MVLALVTVFFRRALVEKQHTNSLRKQALQNAVERLSKYVTSLEDKMDALERKKK